MAVMDGKTFRVGVNPGFWKRMMTRRVKAEPSSSSLPCCRHERRLAALDTAVPDPQWLHRKTNDYDSVTRVASQRAEAIRTAMFSFAYGRSP